MLFENMMLSTMPEYKTAPRHWRQFYLMFFQSQTQQKHKNKKKYLFAEYEKY